MNKFQTVAEIKSDGAGDARTFTAKITTNSVDRDGEVLIPQGMDARDYKKNPVVFWNHDYNLPIGTAADMKRNDDHWTATAKLASTPFAQEVYTLMREGVVRGVSVGFVPIESRPPTKGDLSKFGDDVRRVYSKWKLLEFSVVPLPANQDALITAVSKGVSRATIKSVLGVDVPEPPAPEPRRVVYFCPSVKRADTGAAVRQAVAETLARLKGRPYL